MVQMKHRQAIQQSKQVTVRQCAWEHINYSESVPHLYLKQSVVLSSVRKIVYSLISISIECSMLIPTIFNYMYRSSVRGHDSDPLPWKW